MEQRYQTVVVLKAERKMLLRELCWQPVVILVLVNQSELEYFDLQLFPLYEKLQRQNLGRYLEMQSCEKHQKDADTGVPHLFVLQLEQHLFLFRLHLILLEYWFCSH